MKNWIRHIFKKNETPKKQVVPAMPLSGPAISHTQFKSMVQMIGKTQEVEISCDEVHRLLGQFAEMALRGEDTASLLPLVHHHLEMCPDCREEYNALLQILQASPD